MCGTCDNTISLQHDDVNDDVYLCDTKIIQQKPIWVVFTGDVRSGKTCLFKRKFEDTFDFYEDQTIGIDFKYHDTTHNGTDIRFNVCDTAGHSHYAFIIDIYIKKADIILLLFDVNDKSSFIQTQKTYELCKKICGPKTKYLLVGTKIDIRPDEFTHDIVKSYDVEEFIKNNKMQYFKISSKTNAGVDALFNAINGFAYDLLYVQKTQTCNMKNNDMCIML